MAISNYSKDEFGRSLNDVVFPSRPIRSIEFLQGRSEELETIERALYQTGRHIFIFGDRGVGKSSLGATAAFQYQSVDAEPIFVAGSVDDTFKSIVANIANKALSRSRTESKSERETYGIEWRGLRWSIGTEVNALDIAAQIQSTGDAADLLKQVAERHSKTPIVVIDEFDTITDIKERNQFASLLKQLGDQSINLKFIFTGIGKSLQELLGAHPSTFRQLETLELQRLSWEGRREIVQKAAHAFNLTVDDNVLWRIAIVSDGFPYYVQLITEKMLWEAFTADSEIDEMGNTEYQLGLQKAIHSINAELKRPYEKAVLQREQEYEDAVWASADGENLHRKTTDLYESYKIILLKRGLGEEPLSQQRFTEILRRLKQEKYGGILQSMADRPGWYTYKEKMLRGFVRMQAEANGIELSGERAVPKQIMSIPNVKTGYYTSRIPRDVNQRKKL